MPSPAPRAPALRVLAALLVLTGGVLLWAHVTLHPPVTGSFHALHGDMPEGHEEVRVVTDAAVRVGSEDAEHAMAIVCVDEACPFVIRAYPDFNASRWGTGDRWLFHAVVPAHAEWVPFGEANVTVDAPEGVRVPDRARFLQGVTWDAAPAPSPSPWLAVVGLLALGSALLVVGAEYGLAGPALALGFLAQHAVALTTFLVPELLLRVALWTAAVVGVALVVAALARPRWRAWAPAGALLLAFAVGAWVERALLEGYRPFTGVY